MLWGSHCPLYSHRWRRVSIPVLLSQSDSFLETTLLYYGKFILVKHQNGMCPSSLRIILVPAPLDRSPRYPSRALSPERSDFGGAMAAKATRIAASRANSARTTASGPGTRSNSRRGSAYKTLAAGMQHVRNPEEDAVCSLSPFSSSSSPHGARSSEMTSGNGVTSSMRYVMECWASVGVPSGSEGLVHSKVAWPGALLYPCMASSMAIHRSPSWAFTPPARHVT